MVQRRMVKCFLSIIPNWPMIVNWRSLGWLWGRELVHLSTQKNVVCVLIGTLSSHRICKRALVSKIIILFILAVKHSWGLVWKMFIEYNLNFELCPYPRCCYSYLSLCLICVCVNRLRRYLSVRLCPRYYLSSCATLEFEQNIIFTNHRI